MSRYVGQWVSISRGDTVLSSHCWQCVYRAAELRLGVHVVVDLEDANVHMTKLNGMHEIDHPALHTFCRADAQFNKEKLHCEEEDLMLAPYDEPRNLIEHTIESPVFCFYIIIDYLDFVGHCLIVTLLYYPSLILQFNHYQTETPNVGY